jgi:hypothetical protein
LEILKETLSYGIGELYARHNQEYNAFLHEPYFVDSRNWIVFEENRQIKTDSMPFLHLFISDVNDLRWPDPIPFPKNSMVRSRIFLHLGGAALLLSFLLSLLTGCASFRQMEMPPLPENLPASHELTAVPFSPQEKYQCGPAALAMAISWSGLPIRL